MASKLDNALALAAMGFKVFPLTPGAKAPPLVLGWPKVATSDPSRVRAFWSRSPDANIGISCEGLAVVDIDVSNGKAGENSFALLGMVDELPDTLTNITPTGGRHVIYRLPEGHPGIPNSVEELGAGLDIRSTGGYIVGPGSTILDKQYRFEKEVPIAPVPDWLVTKLGTTVPKVSTAVEVPDAPQLQLDQAEEWLKAQPPAVEGEGGDAHTYAVACGLRDRGVSPAQALELIAEWNDACFPPWSETDLRAKITNAYKYAQNEPGERAITLDGFEPVVQPEVPKPKAGPAIRLKDFLGVTVKRPGYLIKNLLQRQSYAELFGAPGAGKTFVALDMAYHVAAGLPWMGHKVHQGAVLYLAYEGTGGLYKRAQALQNKYGNKDVPFYLAGNTAFNLRELAGRKALADMIATLPELPSLIVIDTLARALMGGDENSAQDVGAFNTAVAQLIETTGACVMIIHHSGKNKAAGARGSSALLGAIDSELEVDERQVIPRKQRDIELLDPINFDLEAVEVGTDEDGEPIKSCVVVEGKAPDAPDAGVRLSGNAKRGFDILCELAPDNHPVSETSWRSACAEFLGSNNARQRFYDIKKKLLKVRIIVCDDVGLITRRMQ